jgi:hypothetical protein
MYVYIPLTWCAWQARSKKSTDCVCPDINLLKSTRIEFADQPAPFLSLPSGPHSSPKWLEYVYKTAALAANQTGRVDWCQFGVILQDELGFPDKADQKAKPGSGWTPAELNHILQTHVEDTLTTFGCVEWESNLCRGIMSLIHVCQMLSNDIHLISQNTAFME